MNDRNLGRAAQFRFRSWHEGSRALRLGLLEDDAVWRAEAERIVTSAGHSCHPFPTVTALRTALRRESFDLLLLDWNLPDSSGLELLRWAQEHLNPCPPVIMVTSRNDAQDIVGALEAGADDYIVKPCDPEVLAARIGALLRRAYATPATPDKQETLWDLTFHHDRQAVTVRSEDVTLTAKEFNLALLLFRNMDRPMSRAHLFETVWGRSSDIQTRTLDVHISKIRSRLGLRPENGFRLLPVHSFGYRLEKTVSDPVQSAE